MRTLLGKEQGCSPDGEKIADSMPIFDERGLVPLEPSRPPGSPVTVSSDKSDKEEREDSEVTW